MTNRRKLGAITDCSPTNRVACSPESLTCPRAKVPALCIRLDFGTGLLERVGTGIVGTIGYVVLPTGVSTDVSRDIV